MRYSTCTRAIQASKDRKSAIASNGLYHARALFVTRKNLSLFSPVSHTSVLSDYSLRLNNVPVWERCKYCSRMLNTRVWRKPWDLSL